jgi:uncharacterized membrane protein
VPAYVVFPAIFAVLLLAAVITTKERKDIGAWLGYVMGIGFLVTLIYTYYLARRDNTQAWLWIMLVVSWALIFIFSDRLSDWADKRRRMRENISDGD